MYGPSALPSLALLRLFFRGVASKARFFLPSLCKWSVSAPTLFASFRMYGPSALPSLALLRLFFREQVEKEFKRKERSARASQSCLAQRGRLNLPSRRGAP